MRQASRAVMSMFADVTPLVEPLSVDEAFLDVSGAGRQFGRPVVIAQRLRARIHDELGLIATVGAASTKFVAKLASGLAKPDGLLIVPPADVLGCCTRCRFARCGGSVRVPRSGCSRSASAPSARSPRSPLDQLVRTLGPASGSKLHDLAWGRDGRTVQTEVAEASIGAETTFAADTSDPAYLARQLLALTEKTAARARQIGVRGRTVSIKVRFEDFSTVTRSATLAVPTDLSRAVYNSAVTCCAGCERRVRVGNRCGCSASGWRG